MSLLSPPSTNSTPLSHYHSLTPSPAILTSPLGTPSSASSSSVSISLTAETKNVTITASRSLAPKQNGKRKSQEDIRLLAILTHITELSYSLSDIQTQIQELRHKPQSDGGVDATVTAEIDNALMSMTDRLEAIDRGLKTVNESIAPYQPVGGGQLGETSELTVVLRKHAALLREWDAVQQETEELQQELKEDKWITVFRTVTEQADGMMASLEKAVNKCQDFIRQVYKRGGESASRLSCSSLRSEKSPISLETFHTLLGSFNAKKEHYVPATTKVLAIMDNGVRNRVTKNGEALRRHTEAAKRWRLLQERMDRTEREMENVRKILVSADQALSEAGSSSGNTANGYLATPPSGSLKGRTTERSSLSRSMSPLKKLAKRLTGSMKSPATPPDSLPVSRASSQSLQSQTPLEPRKRLFAAAFISRPDALDANVTIKQKSAKQPWNASTKVESEALATVKPTPSKRPTAKSLQLERLVATVVTVTSSISTAPSNPSIPPLPIPYRPPSRAQTPGLGTTPRPRPRTPSGIPVPALSQHGRSVSARHPGADDDTEEAELTLMQRAFSPALTQSTSSPGTRSALRSGTPSGSRVPPPRPPSRSRIPLPSVHVFGVSASPLDASRITGLSFRAQTPESTLKTRAQQVRLPPSSYRDTSSTRTPSRPGSRAGAHTPNLDSHQQGKLLHAALRLSRDQVVETSGETTTKKVMCRVGAYMLNRQAGL
ncbi:hypothetical protein EDD16DRAFT_1597438 [Pisolithus croceorrhizus]|nr:hypothetical protein EDD16DRAFT_1597438 [Pisolithus croceorrhizus]